MSAGRWCSRTGRWRRRTDRWGCGWRMTYETREESAACVRAWEGSRYFTGAVQGGRVVDYLAAAERMAAAVEADHELPDQTASRKARQALMFLIRGSLRLPGNKRRLSLCKRPVPLIFERIPGRVTLGEGEKTSFSACFVTVGVVLAVRRAGGGTCQVGVHPGR